MPRTGRWSSKGWTKACVVKRWNELGGLSKTPTVQLLAAVQKAKEGTCGRQRPAAVVESTEEWSSYVRRSGSRLSFCAADKRCHHGRRLAEALITSHRRLWFGRSVEGKKKMREMKQDNEILFKFRINLIKLFPHIEKLKVNNINLGEKN